MRGWFSCSASPPNGGRDGIEGVQLRADGSAVLRVRVKAVPDNGQANAAVVALLGKALGVPTRAISLVGGHRARLKTVRIDGDPATLADRLASIG